MTMAILKVNSVYMCGALEKPSRGISSIYSSEKNVSLLHTSQPQVKFYHFKNMVSPKSEKVEYSLPTSGTDRHCSGDVLTVRMITH